MAERIILFCTGYLVKSASCVGKAGKQCFPVIRPFLSDCPSVPCPLYVYNMVCPDLPLSLAV